MDGLNISSSTGQKNALNNMGGLFPFPKTQAQTSGVTSVPSSSSNPYGLRVTGLTTPKVIPTSAATSSEPGSMSSYVAPKITAPVGGTQNTGITQNQTAAPIVNPNAPVSATAPGTQGNPGTNFPQNLGNVQTASTPNQTYQNAIQQQLGVNQSVLQPLTQAQMVASQLGYGGQNESVGQNLADAQRAFTTGGLAGELGSLNNKISQGLTGAGQELQGLSAAQQATLGGQQLQTQGAESVAGLTAPQPYGITTTPYQPGTNTFGTLPGGGSGAFSAGQVQGNVASGQQFQTMLLPAYNNAGTIKGDLQNFLSQNPDINSSALNSANFAKNWISGTQLSDPKQQELAQYLTEFTNTLTPIIGSQGDVTNFKQSLVNSLINATAQGQSLSQALDNIYKIAGQKLQGTYQAGTQPYNPNITSSGGSPTSSDLYSW